MRPRCHFLCLLFLILVNFWHQDAFAQLGFDLKIDKPRPYEERVLRAEKTGEKPLKAQKKFFQNLTTHYNYYFNASNRLNESINEAKASFKEDYTRLLPFYNYSLDITAADTSRLDSVIYKSKTGIVMHDLRNDWIDNLYLLWGAAWFFEKKFDSAALMFQFINYAFAEKEKDGYYRYIGSRMDGNNALSISTPEKSGFPKNTVTPPSRNNAFIWQARTMIELGNFAEAGSLIATLKNDPLFPARLTDDLEEVQAYLFYKQSMWDSSAFHLVRSLSQAKTKQELARWEFLAAQMLERTGQFEEAGKWYAHSIGHTTDPVMDIYARLNLVRINKSGEENYIDKNIAELLKMARRDRFSDYRHVIYFMAAQMELERNDLAAAQALLLKSALYNTSDPSSRNRSYLLVADLAYDRKKYLEAASYYDSIQVTDLPAADASRVGTRKGLLKKVVSYSHAIAREDSLQRIAALPEEERTVYITRLVKQLRRQQGLSEDVPVSSGNPARGAASADLFTGQPKGEWYFYNTTLKTQGAVQFKQVWGNRPNVDNWRRFSDVNQQLVSRIPTNSRDASRDLASNLPIDNTPTFNSLVANLPLDNVKLQASNTTLVTSLYGLAATYLNEVEDYPSAIETYEKIRTRFPGFNNMNELLFNLYYAYKKSGNEAKAEEVKKKLTDSAPSSRFATILQTGKDPQAPANRNAESTRAYEAVYDLFLEGKFEEAEAAKKKADSLYKTSYWQPQLLYIEAVYNIKQRRDSVARDILQTLIGQNPDGPLAAKAQTMLDVLRRRSQIEAELAGLQIQRPPEEEPVMKPVVKAAEPPTVQTPPPSAKRDSIITAPKKETVVAPNPRKPVDTSARKPIVVQKPASVYRFDPAMKHSVMIILDKVDPMFVNEVKNAFNRYNKEKYYNQILDIGIRDLDSNKKLVLIGDFQNAQEAVEYLSKAKRLAPTEVVPWLKADKYSFLIMTSANLEVLLERKDLEQYRQFLVQNLPGKF